MKDFKSITIYLLFLCSAVNAQEFDKSPTLTLFTGMINYQGDLNPNSFTFRHSNFCPALVIRKPLNRWFTARAGIAIGRIEAADRYNRDYLKPRNLSFYNTITELHMGLEINVLDITTKHFSPYMFGGGALFHSNPWTYDNAGKKTYLRPLSTEGEGLPEYPDQPVYGLYQLALAFGGGFRIRINDYINVGVEFSQRKSFTDHIDDVSTYFPDKDVLLRERGAKAVELSYRGDEVPGGSQVFPQHGEQRGTPSEMDWYYFLGATVEMKFSALGTLFSRSNSGTHGSYYQRCPRHITY